MKFTTVLSGIIATLMTATGVVSFRPCHLLKYYKSYIPIQKNTFYISINNTYHFFSSSTLCSLPTATSSSVKPSARPPSPTTVAT